MHPDTGVTTIDVPRSTIVRTPRHRDRFFLAVAVVATLSVLLGFARTYYLKSLFPTPTFPTLFHIHGAAFTAWMCVLVLQAFLIAARKAALHRTVGWIGLPLMITMVVTGTLVSLAAARGHGPVSAAVQRGEMAWVRMGIPREEVLLMNLTAMLLFGVFAAAGVVCRHRPGAHKRLMMLATIGLLPAAIGRAAITLLGVFHPALLVGSVVFFVLALAIHDHRIGKHVHPVTVWGGLILTLSFPARMAVAKTGLWLSAAAWLIH